jgi:hypothetical protein
MRRIEIRVDILMGILPGVRMGILGMMIIVDVTGVWMMEKDIIRCLPFLIGS